MNKADAINEVKKSLTDAGIKNYYLQTGILSVINKESGFVPKVESSYSKTSNERLRTIFPSKLKALPDDKLTILKKNDKVFYDFIYGNRYGNTGPSDAYNYRGRGLNQITFKDLYKHYGDIVGIDLVKEPDRLNDTTVASKVAAAFFNEGLSSGIKSGAFKQFGVEKLQDIDSIDKGLMVAYQVNAGLKTNLNTPFFKDSIALAKKNINQFIDQDSKGSGVAAIIVAILLIGTFFFVNKNKNISLP